MSGVFILQGEDKLLELDERPYDSEELLQKRLAQYPNLIVGDQINPDSPRRWLLIKREVPVGDSADSSGRWSLDHLFVDQDAVPTLVEVKRATDTRARREVVAQPGVKMDPKRANKRPNLKLSIFTAPQKLRQLLDTYDWFISEIKSAN